MHTDHDGALWAYVIIQPLVSAEDNPGRDETIRPGKRVCTGGYLILIAEVAG